MLIGIVLLALGAAAAQGDEAPSALIRTLGCPRVEIVSPRAQPRTRIAVVSAATVGDLEIRVSYRRSLPGHRVVLKVYTPKGHLYQELPAQPAAGERQLSVRLPVSGTLIVNSSLYGRWRIATHMDDDVRPCGAVSMFTITR